MHFQQLSAICISSLQLFVSFEEQKLFPTADSGIQNSFTPQHREKAPKCIPEETFCWLTLPHAENHFHPFPHSCSRWKPGTGGRWGWAGGLVLDPALGTGPPSLTRLFTLSSLCNIFFLWIRLCFNGKEKIPSSRGRCESGSAGSSTGQSSAHADRSSQSSALSQATCLGTRSPPAPGGRKLLMAGNRDGLLFSIKGRVRDPGNEASEPTLQGMTPPAAQGCSLRAGQEP